MKTYITLLAALSIATAIVSCNDESDASKGSAPPPADSANVELQKAAEPNLRTGLQIVALVQQERSRAIWWQSAATTIAIAGVLLFLAGILIGTTARNESRE